MELIKFVENPETQERFVDIIKSQHRLNNEEAVSLFRTECFNFTRQLTERNIPEDVTPISTAGVFLDVISNGLSFAEHSQHVYIMTRNAKIKYRDEKGVEKERWEKRLVWKTQPNGKIYQCQRAGSIEDVTKPVVVYEGDVWEIKTEEGYTKIKHVPKIPHGKNIIACFVYIKKPKGEREPFILDVEDIKRLEAYSRKENQRKDQNAGPNPLYKSNDGQIDVGFLKSKCISHALKNERKHKISSQHEVPEDFTEERPQTVANNQETNTESPAPQPSSITDIEPIEETPNTTQNDRRTEADDDDHF